MQAERSDGFPWDTWAGSLNLFVWLVVSAYLFWGCDTRLPAARARRAAAGRVPAARRLARRRNERPTSGRLLLRFLVLHVGLVLAAFAGFTLSAALAALYLWQERRLKLRRAGDSCSVALPSLVTLDALEGRMIAFAAARAHRRHRRRLPPAALARRLGSTR